MRNLARESYINNVLRPAIREAIDRGLFLPHQSGEFESLCRRWLARVHRRNGGTSDMARFNELVHGFLDRATVEDRAAATPLAWLYAALQRWCLERSKAVPTGNMLRLALRHRGHRQRSCGDGRYMGIALKPGWAIAAS